MALSAAHADGGITSDGSEMITAAKQATGARRRRDFVPEGSRYWRDILAILDEEHILVDGAVEPLR